MMHHRIFFLSMLAVSFFFTLVAGCSGDSDSDVSFSISIEDRYSGLLDAAQETEIAETVELFNLMSYRATVLINSTLFADFYRTSPDVIKARAIAAQTAIDDLNTVAAYLIQLEEQNLLPLVQANMGRKLMAKSATGDLYHAKRLIDLYMNDDAFYRKYKLSDIARRTGVSMTRLRMMMQQVTYEIETAGYVTVDQQYEKAVRNCKAIRDTAVTAEGVLVTVATGGAGAAGTLTTLQKTVQVVEGVNTVLNVAESGVNVVNAAIGTDEKPPVIDKIFKANKVVSYLLIPKAVGGKDVGSIVALVGPVNDGTDLYFNINGNSDTVEVSSTPKKTTSEAQHKQRQEVLDDLLLPGDYQLPKSQLVVPNSDNSGFSFVDEPTSDDDFVLDAVNMADLWDLPDATKDDLSWNTDAENPDSSMEHVSSQGILSEDNPLFNDSLLFDPVLVDPPAVTVTASPASGEAPLIVTFQATVENPSNEALTYAWHFGDGGYEESALSYPDHTYTEAGTFRVTVYVSGDQLGQLMGAITVQVQPGTAVTPDGDGPDYSEGTCYTPAGINACREVQTGVVMCNPLYRVEQVCAEARPGRSVFEEVRSCDDGNPLTWDRCGEAAADCSASCEHDDWSGTVLPVQNCTAGYRDGYNQGEQWCMDDVLLDDDGNPTLYPVIGIYTCNGENEIVLVAACQCYYDWEAGGEPYCHAPTPYPYGEY